MSRKTKPEWDESKEGRNPALADLGDHKKTLAAHALLTPDALAAAHSAAIHAEAASLMNSPAQALMVPEQKFLATWQQHEAVARASLEMFSNPDLQVDDREAKITQQRSALATALYKLGRLGEALHLLSETDPLYQRIYDVMEAITKPDTLEHECPREVSTIDGPRGEVEIELDRRVAEEEIFSPQHQKVVSIYRCSICGELNATPETPERQQRYAEMRQQIIALTAAGKPIPASLQAAEVLKKALV